MRDTFLKDINKYLGLEYRFFIGDGTPTGEDETALWKSFNSWDIVHYKKKVEEGKNLRIAFTPKPDEVVLHVPDDYAHIPYKTRANKRWALKEGFDFVFQCFPDTYIDLQRLMCSGFEKHSYIGKPGGYAGGGCGYWTDKKASQIIADAPVTDWADDRWVGSLLKSHGIALHGDNRYADYPTHPTADNDAITSHLACTPVIYNNRLMYTMQNSNCIMQGLWVGNSLSEMEQLSIKSFLANGHMFHLYTYGKCEGVPAGCQVKDANEIMPKESISQYVSLANFSDAFRWRLLSMRGCWWVDVDTICLKHYDFKEDYVFGSEVMSDGTSLVDASPIKAPQDSEFLKRAILSCETQDTLHPKGKLNNGTIALGPELVDTLTRELRLTKYIHPPCVFNPVLCQDVKELINPDAKVDISNSYAVHLWHSQWGWQNMSGKTYSSHCLYEVLKRKYINYSPDINYFPDAVVKSAANPNVRNGIVHSHMGYCRRHRVLGCERCSVDQYARW